MTTWTRRFGTVCLIYIMSSAGLLTGTTSPKAVHLNRGFTADVQVQPEFRRAQRASESTFSCQLPTASLRCYGPHQIRKAYDIDRVLDRGTTGRGRTVVIIDAFGYPNVAADLHAFDAAFGLADPTLNQIYPDGKPVFDPTDENQVGWSYEIALDVQWAHAIAPQATIDLVIAKSNDDIDILSATAYAIEHDLGDVISQSFGESESCMDPRLARRQHDLFEKATKKSITLIAATGDQGSAQLSCDLSSYRLAASSPATDPYVLAVGGTHLDADPSTGDYRSETVWNNEFGASGGGFSTQFARPLYQRGVPGIGRARGVPDVSYNGDLDGGVLVAWSGDGAPAGNFYLFGGTSAGAPQWAGITALADQQAGRRLGWLNPAIYVLARTKLYARVLHDVTRGDNTFTGMATDGSTVTVPGYSAGRGWDAATGWGSPDVGELLSVVPRASTSLA